MTTLFDGPLRQHLALNPFMVLAQDKLFLVMENQCKVTIGGASTLSKVRYSAREPLSVNPEMLAYSNWNAVTILHAMKVSSRVWCIQLGFAALQKALRRRTLQRLSRLHRARLFICLLSLLKTVSEERHRAGWWSDMLQTVLGDKCLYSEQFVSRRRELISILSHYLRYLASHCFAPDSPIHDCFVTSQSGILVSYFIFSVVGPEVRRVLEEVSDELPKATYEIEGIKSARPSKIAFSDMVTSPNGTSEMQSIGVDGTKQSSQTSEKDYWPQMERLSLAFARCALDDDLKQEPVPVKETFEDFDGKLTPVWTL